MKLKYSKKNILDIVNNSKSKRECLIKLKLSPCGGNYQLIQRYFELYDIDTNHFLGQGWNKGNTPADVKPIEKYFNNEIPITSYKLKRRLLKDGLKFYQCEMCNRVEWNNHPIPLELHHINGNNHDNSFSNLSLLCPNCHALTSNYRNRK